MLLRDAKRVHPGRLFPMHVCILAASGRRQITLPEHKGFS